MPQFCFIFNPNSGLNRKRPGFLPKLRARIAALGFDAEFRATERPHHATELARDAVARGIPRIVAVGGDGTLNEVACGVVGTDSALALIPCGSGNGLGRHLGVHGSLEHALLVARDGRIRAIDTGVAAGHRFCNAMGVGFDAEIARRFNNLPTRGLRTYVRTGWNTYFGYRPETYSIRGADAVETRREAFIVAVLNSDQYGNNARIAPGASVDDGQLDLVAIPAMGFARSALFVGRLFCGDARRHHGVLSARGSGFTIRRAAPGVIHVDGETRDAGAEIDVHIEPASLRFVVPA
ncbi:MAG TPA: diacylglycerol kinase family protein [Opitutaceae bacterium]|nr:diacylglycerol kinase family protein [Opitutaceae bacterium]